MSKRFGSLVTSAVSNRWMIYEGVLDAGLLIGFLEPLVPSMKGRKVYRIRDNLHVHHSHSANAWVEEHQQTITVHHLPSYGPEFNPGDQLNRPLKSILSHLPSAKDERSLQKVNHRQTAFQAEGA